jgi:hypothetical protein
MFPLRSFSRDIPLTREPFACTALALRSEQIPAAEKRGASTAAK